MLAFIRDSGAVLSFGGIKVIVAHKIVHDKEVGRSKAPERFFPRAVGVGIIS